MGEVNHAYDVRPSITAQSVRMIIRFRRFSEANLSPIMYRGRVARLGKTQTRFSRNPN